MQLTKREILHVLNLVIGAHFRESLPGDDLILEEIYKTKLHSEGEGEKLRHIHGAWRKMVKQYFMEVDEDQLC